MGEETLDYRQQDGERYEDGIRECFGHLIPMMMVKIKSIDYTIYNS